MTYFHQLLCAVMLCGVVSSLPRKDVPERHSVPVVILLAPPSILQKDAIPSHAVSEKVSTWVLTQDSLPGFRCCQRGNYHHRSSLDGIFDADVTNFLHASLSNMSSCELLDFIKNTHFGFEQKSDLFSLEFDLNDSNAYCNNASYMRSKYWYPLTSTPPHPEIFAAVYFSILYIILLYCWYPSSKTRTTPQHCKSWF